jgi:hypothetical protein
VPLFTLCCFVAACYLSLSCHASSRRRARRVRLSRLVRLTASTRACREAYRALPALFLCETGALLLKNARGETPLDCAASTTICGLLERASCLLLLDASPVLPHSAVASFFRLYRPTVFGSRCLLRVCHVAAEASILQAAAEAKAAAASSSAVSVR